MTVSKKAPFILLLTGIIFFIFGYWLIDSLENENEFLPVFGKLIGVGSIILVLISIKF
ncbi:hypothetical protein [Hydrogenimonas thermophila]|uniref:Uncharacterized protein n=1 Tax=Hydrogenimonas thermophila TaxID=223786 RepID=A0A1I5PBF2_9BACT|nr:hypothetical protein [Hydrogenimonas thermophila]WOE69672.1 hypothetical protein RZR91_11260 [Hydrogenimonas thermophila]WOE72186.1 hypothetical protein RZR97_11250 [Hydrogenimonas thermophila]SFP31448.1 hypothetical protein SAMN05216234_11452 [Hydrogenimonas thermophila]